MKKISFLQNDKAPYRNRSFKNLKAEKWVAVPGFEESYQISNYGRMKSLAREIHYANGKVIRLRTFDSIKEAAAAVGIKDGTLSGALSGAQKTSGGYKWKYVTLPSK